MQWHKITVFDPLLEDFDKDKKWKYQTFIFQPVVSMKFLGDEETVKKAMEAVANQGKAK